MNNGKKNKGNLLHRFARYCIEQVLTHEQFLPVVDEKGNVIGKTLAMDAFGPDDPHTHPVIRIAVTAEGRLLLRPRPDDCRFHHGRIDTPLESCLFYRETLEQGVQRLLRRFSSDLPDNPQPHFNLMYRYKDGSRNLLVYLFTFDLSDETHLNGHGGKFWTLKQIEHDLEKHYFSPLFENEYETLKEIILIRQQFNFLILNSRRRGGGHKWG